MYGIIGEDKSDVETLKVIVRRLANNNSLTIRTKGYEGCSEMLRKGAHQLLTFEKLGATRFVICYDADREEPSKRHNRAVTEIWQPSGVSGTGCVVVPIQEIEAWILADLSAAHSVFPGWKPPDHPNPENVDNPKEYLEKQSRQDNRRPRYVHAVHNPRVAQYIDLGKVAARCQSFLPLRDLVLAGVSHCTVH